MAVVADAARRVSGVGENKLVKYGEGVIEVLAGLADGGAAAKTPDQAGDADPGADHWPEMDAEPAPEDDWI